MALTLKKKNSRIKFLHPPGWNTRFHPNGWLEVWRLLESPVEDPLVWHGERPGLGKIVRNQDQWEERFTFYLGPNAGEEEVSEGTTRQELAQELVSQAAGAPGPKREMAGPSVEQVAGWLVDAGFETATDKNHNLRLTLKRVGCDGQVRWENQPNRMRFTLTLGSWPSLDGMAEKGMRMLAEYVNASLRLVRIALVCQGKSRRFEAQVDLTELPYSEEVIHQKLWSQMCVLALKSLDLALRHLGLELALLADHPEIAQMVLASEEKPGRPLADG